MDFYDPAAVENEEEEDSFGREVLRRQVLHQRFWVFVL